MRSEEKRQRVFSHGTFSLLTPYSSLDYEFSYRVGYETALCRNRCSGRMRDRQRNKRLPPLRPLCLRRRAFLRKHRGCSVCGATWVRDDPASYAGSSFLLDLSVGRTRLGNADRILERVRVTQGERGPGTQYLGSRRFLGLERRHVVMKVDQIDDLVIQVIAYLVGDRRSQRRFKGVGVRQSRSDG